MLEVGLQTRGATTSRYAAIRNITTASGTVSTAGIGIDFDRLKPHGVRVFFTFDGHDKFRLSRCSSRCFIVTSESIKMAYSFALVNDRDGLIAMCVLFSITSTTAVAFRFYARRIKGLRFQADDWLIAISLVKLHIQIVALK